MAKPSRDPSVEDEPHLRAGRFQPDASEARADRAMARNRREGMTEDEQVEHSVWVEPGLSRELSGEQPEGTLTYAEWLDKRRAQVLPSTSWIVTAFVAALATPWAVLGAFSGTGQTVFSIAMITIVGPVVEETLKVSAALYVVEKKPFLFQSAVQIAVCAIAGGLSFAAIENLLYFHVYVKDPSALYIQWRWTVCVGLHVGCSFIAGLGLIRIWRETWRTQTRPKLSLGYPYLLTAVVIHGLYNTLAVGLHFADFRF